jgi:hypothetical protein
MSLALPTSPPCQTRGTETPIRGLTRRFRSSDFDSRSATGRANDMGVILPRQCSRNRCLAGWTVPIPHRGRGGAAGRANSNKDLVTGPIRGFCALQRLLQKPAPGAPAHIMLWLALCLASAVAWLEALFGFMQQALQALKARERHSLSCVFVPSTSITCRSVLPSPARISIRRGLASGATGIWIVSTPCS